MSRIIKAQFTNTLIDKKIIGLHSLPIFHFDSHEEENFNDQVFQEKFDHIVEEAKQKADEMIQNANLYKENVANEILQEKSAWNEEKQAWIQAAQEQGHNEGFQVGKQDAFVQYEQMLKQAEEIILLAKQDYEKYLDSSEEAILKIGIKVAEKIVGTLLEQNNEVFLPLVKQALKEVKDQENVHIYVHPKYYNLLIQQKEELQQMMSKDTPLFVFADDDLYETSCVIESSFGKIDASVDSQLTEIKEKLLSMLEEE